MRAIGWIDGGEKTVVQALLDAVGPAGTVVAPSQTAYNREPATWIPRPPEERWRILRDRLPAFDPRRTPSWRMGRIAEAVRRRPGARRSSHPQTSFTAVGRLSREITSVHRLASQLGEDSPLAALEAVDAKVLLLGVGFESCSAFHLAEYRLPQSPRRVLHCALSVPGGRRAWYGYETVDLSGHDFTRLGSAFQAGSRVESGYVGWAASKLFPVGAAANFAEKWIATTRHWAGPVGSLNKGYA